MIKNNKRTKDNDFLKQAYDHNNSEQYEEQWIVMTIT